MKKEPSLVILGLAGLTIILTFPLILHLATAIPGDGFDGWQNYWNLWWLKEAVLNLRSSPFFTPYLYYPTGVDLYFHTLNIANGLVALPIQLISNIALAYNFIVFLSFILGGFGTYLLAKYTLVGLGLRGPYIPYLSFFGASIYIFSPFHMAHLLGHMQVFSFHFIPFYILALLSCSDKWLCEDANGGIKNKIVLPSIFLILMGMIDWYLVLYAIIFVAIVIILTVSRAMISRHSLRLLIPRIVFDLLPQIVIFLVALSPQLIPMIREASASNYMKPAFSENISLSADLLAFILPNELHPIWGQWARSLANNFTTTTAERLVFMGFVPLLLGMMAMFKGKSKAIVQLWIATLVIFGILALGPYLHVNGGLVSINNRPLTLPYLLLYQTIPFINIIRSLSRFAMMVMLALAMLATIGIAWLLEGISGQQLLKPTKKTSLATATLFGLILIEYLAIPFPYSEIDTPSFFRQLAEDKDQYAIAYLPMNWDRPVALLYQTVHQKYLATAYTSREQPISRAWRTPLLQNWRYLDEDIVRTDLSEIAATVLHDLNIRLVIMDYFQMPPGTERKETERWVAYAFKNAIPRYKDSRLTVYQAPVPSQAKSYLTLEEGWGDREFIHNSLVRPIIGIATLGIHHPLGRLSLRLELINPGSPSKFSIWVDDRPITTALLPKGYYSLDTGSFTAGETGTQTVILKLETEAPMFLKSIELKSQH